VSKELNLIFEQVARRCDGLVLEGRALVLGVNGPDSVLNASVTKGLKAHLGATGREVAVFHLDSCADAEARQEMAAAIKGGVSPELVQRYCEESIDYALARQTLQELAQGKGIVIAEGLFLYTGALADLFDLRVYLDAGPDTVRSRVEAARSASGDKNGGDALRPLVEVGFAHYVAEYGPGASADLVVDVNDPRKPRVIAAVG
jgi:uridine kinase